MNDSNDVTAALLGPAKLDDEAASSAIGDPTWLGDPFERLLASAPDLICVADADGRLQRVSRACSMLGHHPEELLTRQWLDLIHSEDQPAARAALASLAQRGEAVRLESRFRCKDDRYVWLSWAATADVSRMLYLTARDTSDRRREYEVLRQSHQFLDAIIENIPNMVFVKEAERLAFVRFNRAGEELLGVPRASLLGKNDYDFFPKDEADFFQRKDRETFSGRALVDIPEEPIQTARGTRLLHTKKVPLMDERGKPRYLLGISEDITDFKRIHRELVQAKERAEAANRDLEAFSYSVAHDLRAPLRSIDGFSQALSEDCADQLNAEGKKYLGYIRESAQLMARLIDDILTLSRVTRTGFRDRVVNLTALAQSTIERLRRAEPERRVEVVIAGALECHGDPTLLAVVLDNLLGNAWKFSSKKSDARIEVGTTAGSDPPVYFVRDNGAGFDMAYANKLFGVFQRLHSARDFDGTGIGLATVHRIIQRHGGRVWAEAEVDRGATFYFTLGDTENAT